LFGKRPSRRKQCLGRLARIRVPLAIAAAIVRLLE
jgi:hypothetical protein